VSITFSRLVRFYVFKQAMSTHRLLPSSIFQPWKNKNLFIPMVRKDRRSGPSNERLLNEIYKQNWILRQPDSSHASGFVGQLFYPKKIKISLI
jgi:hypothetical protein